MFKRLSLAFAAVLGAVFILGQTSTAQAGAATPLHVLQIEKHVDADGLLQQVHAWHCRNAYGPFGWHHHPGACRGYYREPYYGGHNIVIRPGYNRRCTRRLYRGCIRRWRRSSKRRARCLRKYGC
ncbi:MAG: hypothetical protein AAGI06_04525 [Pseudomonadota bacterium]